MLIQIFDFDGTLVNTPNREFSEKIYLEDKGVVWPFIGFYGRLESLIPPVFPEIPENKYAIEEVAAICREKKANHTVLMTGRPYKIRHRVLEICKHLGMNFDDCYFRGQKDCDNSGDTFVFKKSILIRLQCLKPTIFEMWEDREDHFNQFSELFDQFRIDYPQTNFILHRVFTPEL